MRRARLRLPLEFHPHKLDDGAAACREAFPTIATPPWRGRKTHWVGLAVPLALIAMGGGALAVHLAFGGSGSEAQENDSSTMSPHAGATSGSRWGNSTDQTHRAKGSLRGPTGTEHDAGVACGGDAQLSSGLGRADGGAPGASGDEDASLVEVNGDLITYRRLVGEGTTISKRLSAHGLSAGQINEVVEAFDGLFNFRQSRPRHRYELEISKATKQIQRFRYEVRSTEIYEAHRNGARLRGHKVKVNVTYHKILAGRRVEGSLAESISKAGLKRGVLSAFLKTFGRDINFRNNQKAGDTFRVVALEERLDGEYVQMKEVSAIEYKGKSVGRQLAFYFHPKDGRGRFYDAKGLSFERTRLRTPLNYTRISSPFDPNRMHPVLKRRVPHRGVDFKAPRGTHVWATADGQVRFVGRKGASGNLVIIRHSGGLESFYAHLQKFAKRLKRGQDVRQGQVIGYVGSTGRSTGPHLHFGLKKNGRFVDPMKVKTGQGAPIKRQHRGKFSKRVRALLKELQRIRIQ